jgi:hypothetical protein
MYKCALKEPVKISSQFMHTWSIFTEEYMEIRMIFE